MNTQINITENGTTTLATAGKYCDRNIDVNVATPDLGKFVQGTIEGEFVSDNVTWLKYAAFYGCSQLTSVSLPNCTTMAGGMTFYNCSKIKTLNIPNLTTISDGNRVFNSMSSVTEINLPKVTKISSANVTFSGCQAVRKIDLSSLGGCAFQTNMFANCYYLHTLILGGTAINTLGNTNCFKDTGIYAENGFSIYVPDNLVDSYKTATNWTAFADKIKPMSELEG